MFKNKNIFYYLFIINPCLARKPASHHQMLLRNSFFCTKKIFSKTIKSLRSFFSGGSYQRLPQTPSYSNPYSPHAVGINMNGQASFNNSELDKFYNVFDDGCGTNNEKKFMRRSKKKAPSSTKQDDDLSRSFLELANPTPANDDKMQRGEECAIYAGKRPEGDNSSSKNTSGTARSFLVEQKLKELEMMDISNVDHVLDIEEVLHYYSRLTCPPYLDIVDRFFMDVYAEFFRPPVTPSRPKAKLRSVRS